MRALTDDERSTVEANLPLVYFLAKRNGGHRLSTREKIQAGTIGLIEAVQGFDPALGEFGQYAARGVVRHIWRAQWTENRTPQPVDMIELDPTEVNDDPAGPVLDDERDELVRSALAELPERQRAVIHARYWRGANHYAQAAERGCTRTNVWLIERKAHGLLRDRLKPVAV